MVLVKMLMKIGPPTMRGIVGDDDGFDFPLPEKSFPGRVSLLESKSAPPQFRLIGELGIYGERAS
jgi:hypothetical protein